MTHPLARFCGALLLASLALHSASAARGTTPTAKLTAFAKTATLGRIVIRLQATAEPTIQAFDGGIELHFPQGTHVVPPPKVNVRQVSGIDLRDDPDGTVVVIHFACNCTATPVSQKTQLRLDIKESPETIRRCCETGDDTRSADWTSYAKPSLPGWQS